MENTTLRRDAEMQPAGEEQKEDEEEMQAEAAGYATPPGKRLRETETPEKGKRYEGHEGLIAALPADQQQLGNLMVMLMGKTNNDIAEVGTQVRRQGARLQRVEQGQNDLKHITEDLTRRMEKLEGGARGPPEACSRPSSTHRRLWGTWRPSSLAPGRVEAGQGR